MIYNVPVMLIQFGLAGFSFLGLGRTKTVSADASPNVAAPPVEGETGVARYLKSVAEEAPVRISTPVPASAEVKETGVARYIKQMPQPPVPTGVAKYLKTLTKEETSQVPETGVSRYLQKLAEMPVRQIPKTGVARYLSTVPAAARETGVARYLKGIEKN